MFKKNQKEFWSIQGMYENRKYIFLNYDAACDFLGSIGAIYLEQNPEKNLPEIKYHSVNTEYSENWQKEMGFNIIKWENPALIRR